MADALAHGFAAALAVLSGSKESIHGAALLFESAPESAAPSLAAVLCARAAELQEHAGRLRLVYVANDVLFAAQRRAQLHSGSLPALHAALPTLLRLTAELAPDAAAAAKLLTLVEFWSSHAVVDAPCAAVLRACVAAPPQQGQPSVSPLPPPPPPPPPLPSYAAVSGTPAAAQLQLATEPSFSAGLIGPLVRQRRSQAADAPYTALARADISTAAAEQLPAVAEEYLSARLARFYEALQRGGCALT
jgi:hypothetical protein